MPRKLRKKRNPIARQLRMPRFRKHIVRSRKAYRRKGRLFRHDEPEPSI